MTTEIQTDTQRPTAPSLTASPAASHDAAPEPLYRFEARLDFHPVGLVPEGLLMTNGFEGRVSGGELARHGFDGARVWGVDPFLLRRDGVGVIDAPKSITTGEVTLYEHVRAYATPPAGVEVPPLETLLEPGFEWPDVAFPIHGFSTFRAAVPELLHLNRSFARVDGWASFATGELVIETRIVELPSP